MSKDTVININQVGAGIEIKQLYNHRSPFSMTMRFNMLQSQTNKPDILDLMAQMTRKEAELFVRIKNNLNYRTNIAVVDFGELCSSQRTELSRNLSTLVKMNLVRRIKVNTQRIYLVNPEYIIPPDSELSAVTDAWNKLK
jgi:predicted transcriptional regulator